MGLFFILLGTLGAALPAAAAANAARTEEECLKQIPSITSPVEIATCTSDLAGSERAVAAALAKLNSRLPDEHRQKLRVAQRTWIAYRDAQCAWDAGGNPGSTGHSSAVIDCIADFNRERAAYLTADTAERW